MVLSLLPLPSPFSSPPPAVGSGDNGSTGNVDDGVDDGDGSCKYAFLTCENTRESVRGCVARMH